MTTRLIASALLSLLLIVVTDATVREDVIVPRGSFESDIFRDFDRFNPQRGTWVASAGAEIVLAGLWALGTQDVEIFLQAKGRRRSVRVLANGHVAFVGEVGDERLVVLQARSDPTGAVRLRFAETEEAAGREALALRVGRVAIRQTGPAAIPQPRLFQYSFLAILLALLPVAFASAARGRVALVGGGPLLFVGALVASRVRTLSALPWILAVLAVALAMVALSSRGFGMSTGAARAVALAAALKLTVVVQGGFPTGDALFHVHRTWTLLRNELVTSQAPGPSGPLAVPYPPAVHALLAPWLFRLPTERAQVLGVSLFVTLLEALTPLLVFGVMRAGGASAGAAATASLAQAAMPEGLLIPAKGLAANAFGSVVGLGVVWAILRRTSSFVLAGLFALALLSHNGASITLVTLVLSWTIYAVRRGVTSWRGASKILGALLGAAMLAWLVYWRETADLLERGAASTAKVLSFHFSEFFTVRWVRVGKVLQDLVLKFGGFPLLLVLAGAQRMRAPSALGPLLTCWLGTGALFGAAALLTPFPLRFEYCLMPAVAMAVGLSAEALGPSRARWAGLALAFTFVVQAALGLALGLGRFRMMSVILESDKWPFPVR